MSKRILYTIVILVLVFCQLGNAQVRLPKLVRDSMVLQRDAKINIWGWASIGEKVSVKFNNKSYKTITNSNGKWMMQLPPIKAGGPYTMEIIASNKILLKDILIGDVWVCSGQSNMVHQMKLHNVTYAKDIATANNPLIRQFWVPTATDLQGPNDDLQNGYWQCASPANILEFSAVAYFFARDLFEKYHVPIGLINASVGGSPIESWISEEGLKNFLEAINIIHKNRDTTYINSLLRKDLLNRNIPADEDKGLIAAKPWYDITYVPKEWSIINIPGFWEDQGLKDLDGVVWYRKEIDVPAAMIGKPARVFLGRIVNSDVLYINGKEVGNTTYQYPQRRYKVPDNLLKPGKNIFVIRVTNNNGKGGFVTDKPYCLFTDTDTIDLKGYWHYKVGQVFTKQSEANNVAFNIQRQPTALYNAMLAPIVNYTIKGVIWYQGESNTGKASEYTDLQNAMIADWRNKWKQDDLPFAYVQLPNFMDATFKPVESEWADFRFAQFKSLTVFNTAMAVAIDLGEWNDLHPDNKKDVGIRLALAAKKIAYGENIVYSGPLFKSEIIERNKIIVSFSNTGSGLVTNNNEELAYFSIAGVDKKFVWAKAKIENDKIIVWSESIINPMYVRYAWADNPAGANLYNKEGLPASPFATDK